MHHAGLRTALALLLIIAAPSRAGDLTAFAPDAERTWQHAGDPAFSMRFPWTWQRNPAARAPIVLEAAEDQVPQLRVMVMDEPWWLPQGFSVRAAATRLEGDGTEVVETGTTTLADGREAATGLVRWQMHVGLGIPLQTWFVSVFHDDRWVLASLTIPDHGQPFPEDLRAVAASVRFE